MRQSTELDVMILEVSSFQLETIDAFRPQVAAWLNFSPNHLDRYRDLEDYRKAKLRVFMNQTPEDYAIVNARENLPPISARRITFSAYEPNADFTLRHGVIFYQGEPVLDQRKTRLEGFHNAENLMAALGVGLALGVELETMAAAVGEFTAPVHRCEFVREFEGVRWINDSKATNLDSVEKAIHSQTRPTVLIAGGKDKGFEFDSIAPLVRERVLVAILIGEMKERIAASWSGVDCRISSSLKRPSPRRGKLPDTGMPFCFLREHRPSTCFAITASGAIASKTPSTLSNNQQPPSKSDPDMKKILIPLRKVPRPTPPPAESLRAKVSANAEAYDAEDYEVEEEPSMKFSHALIVVLALHVIAVGGVFAFNSIKAGQAIRQGENRRQQGRVPPSRSRSPARRPSPAGQERHTQSKPAIPSTVSPRFTRPTSRRSKRKTASPAIR